MHLVFLFPLVIGALGGRSYDLASLCTQQLVYEAVIVSNYLNVSITVFDPKINSGYIFKHVTVGDHVYDVGFLNGEYYFLSFAHQVVTPNVNEYRQYLLDKRSVECTRSRCFVRPDKLERNVIPV